MALPLFIELCFVSKWEGPPWGLPLGILLCVAGLISTQADFSSARSGHVVKRAHPCTYGEGGIGCGNQWGLPLPSQQLCWQNSVKSSLVGKSGP